MPSEFEVAVMDGCAVDGDHFAQLIHLQHIDLFGAHASQVSVDDVSVLLSTSGEKE
jgi:hypothetical protein